MRIAIVASNYAGILGSLAFSLVILRGLVSSAGVESTMGQAALALAAFGMLGYVVGRLAAWIVAESVEASLAAETAARKAANQGKS